MNRIFVLAAGVFVSGAALAQSGSANIASPPAAERSPSADETVADHANAVLQDLGQPEDLPLAMGGPTEERAGYPPCDPGPGDDNCIQLYEKGVGRERG